MDQENNKSRLKQQIQSLRSNNRAAIMDTLKELRSEGDVSVLPDLFTLLLIQEDKNILAETSALLNDLKEQEAAKILADAIADPAYQKIKTILVAACWQNGLSYGKHIDTFVNVIVSGGYSEAIEAFTVIEEAVGELGDRERQQLASSLKSKLRKVDDQLKPLFVELVRVIESYQAPDTKHQALNA